MKIEEEIKKDIEQLKLQAAQHLASFNATNGAIAYAEQVIKKQDFPIDNLSQSDENYDKKNGSED